MGKNREVEIQRWREQISEQQASGKSIVVYCREHELRLWQFYEWKKRLEKSKPSEFVSVSMKPEVEEPSQLPAVLTSSSIELRLHRGWSLQIETGFDADHLRRLLSVLESVS